MGFIAEAMERRSRVMAGVHPSRMENDFFRGVGYGSDATGLNLSEHEVLGWPAVIQALRMLGGSMGMMPCHLYERGPMGKRKLTPNEEHPLHWLLHEEPHPEYTPFEFFFCVVFNACFRGDFYGQILTNRLGEVESIFPLETYRMFKVERVNGKLRYHYRESDGSVRIFLDHELLHVRGFSDGGIVGFAVNELARTSLAKGVAMDRFGARVFKSGMNAAGLVELEQPLKWANKDEERAFFQGIKDALASEDNWHTVIGLPYGMKMRTLGVSAKESQLIEGLTFQVQDVARLFGVPPTLLMENSRNTFTNSEQQMLQFVQLALGQWIVNIEQRIKKSLLSREERKRFVVKFLVDALLRTDIKTQNEAIRTAVGQPWMSVNEARDLKEMPPLEGDQYNLVPTPLNMLNPGGDPAETVDDGVDDGDGIAPAQDGDADTRAEEGPA